MRYGDEDILLLDDVEYNGVILKPEVMIVAVYWPDKKVKVLEVVNFRTRRKPILQVVREKFRAWEEKMKPWQIHAIWNEDMHVISNRRIMV